MIAAMPASHGWDTRHEAHQRNSGCFDMADHIGCGSCHGVCLAMSYTVRRVLPSEYSKYRTHLLALDKDSRYLRFGFAASDHIINRLCDTFEEKREEHVLFAVENSTLDFVAIGHVAITPDMELAFSVLQEYQGKGLGQKLMRRCIQWCRLNGHLTGCMVCLSRNATIRHMCKKHGIHMSSEDGETLGDIRLDDPSLNTVLNEASDMNQAVIDFITKRVRLPWAIQHKRRK